MPLTTINDGDGGAARDAEAQVREEVAPDAVVRDAAAQVRDAAAPARDDVAPGEAARDDEGVVPVRMPVACTCTRWL